MRPRTCAFLALSGCLVLAACGPSRIQVSGQVIGQLGLPVEGARVAIPGHEATRADGDGGFLFEEVAVPYDILVAATESTGQSAAAWLGLSRADPVLVLDAHFQVGVHTAVVCGPLSGTAVFPQGFTPYALPMPGGQPSAVDPSTNTFCSAVRWVGEPQTLGSIHVLGPDYAPGWPAGPLVATGFPVYGAVEGLTLVDQGRVDGVEIALTSVPANVQRVSESGLFGNTTMFNAWAFFGPEWFGFGSPLAQSSVGPPWPDFAVPSIPNARVRLWAYTHDDVSSAIRSRSVSVDSAEEKLDLPRAIRTIDPPAQGSFTVGTHYRWSPAQENAVFSMLTGGSGSFSETIYLRVTASSPDIPFPDFSLVGVQVPLLGRAGKRTPSDPSRTSTRSSPASMSEWHTAN